MRTCVDRCIGCDTKRNWAGYKQGSITRNLTLMNYYFACQIQHRATTALFREARNGARAVAAR